MIRRKSTWYLLAIVIILLLVYFLGSVLNTKTEAVVETFDSQQVNEVLIDDSNTEIEVKVSTNNQVVLRYQQTKDKVYTVELNNNKELTLKRQTKGLRFQIFGFKFNKVILELPIKYFDLDVSTSNGVITIDGVLLNTARVNTTNGKVLVKNTEGKDLNLSTTNGVVVTEKVVSVSLRAITTNGRITVDSTLIHEYLEAKSTNGGIKAKLIGSQNDYDVTCQTTNGRCDIPITRGSKKIFLTTTNGSISLEFEE